MPSTATAAFADKIHALLRPAPSPKAAPKPVARRRKGAPTPERKPERLPMVDLVRRISQKAALLRRNDPAYPWKAARIIARYEMSPLVRERGRFQALVEFFRCDPGVTDCLLDQAKASIQGAQATLHRKWHA